MMLVTPDPGFPRFVIAGLDPAIHGAAGRWMTGSSPVMTENKELTASIGAAAVLSPEGAPR
jgi:hypothetical protein